MCWYCGERIPDPALTHEIEMYKDAEYEAVSHKRTQMTWLEKRILVPRCSHCAKLHKKFNIALGAGLGAVFLGILNY